MDMPIIMGSPRYTPANSWWGRRWQRLGQRFASTRLADGCEHAQASHLAGPGLIVSVAGKHHPAEDVGDRLRVRKDLMLARWGMCAGGSESVVGLIATA
ncbi:MAG: hypothetical protein CM15mP103_02770 [Gammaproteobacteria bacterium]|nr:MAG: hypothetical protein CM15mP103_02770 [Gammaproteobacteria bacterium]